MDLIAMTTAKELLTKYGEYFQQNNIIITALRSIFWFFLLFLKELIDILSGIMGAAYQLLTFDFSSLDSFVKQGTAVNQYSFSQYAFIGSLTVLVLVGIGIAMILGFQNIKGTLVLRNILFGILVIAVLPTAMNMLNGAFASATDLDEVPLGTIFKSNTYDLQYICTTGNGVFESNDGDVTINNFPNSDEWINQLQIGAVIRGTETKGIDEVFLKKLDYSDGEATAVESTARGELPFGIYFEPLATDYYYRYSVDMLPIFLTEIATLLVIVFTTFKVARLSYELVIHRIFAQALALTDIAGGARLREILKAICSTYVVLAYCPVALRVFLSFQEWMFGVNSPFDNSIVPSFFLLAIALAVIDGPNLIERIFNIDAGIQSGFKTAMAAVGIGRMAAGAMHGISHGISGVGKGIGRFADSHRTTPTAKDRRSALRSSRASEYAQGYNKGESIINKTAQTNGGVGLKTEYDTGKEKGLRDTSRKLSSRHQKASSHLSKENEASENRIPNASSPSDSQANINSNLHAYSDTNANLKDPDTENISEDKSNPDIQEGRKNVKKKDGQLSSKSLTPPASISHGGITRKEESSHSKNKAAKKNNLNSTSTSIPRSGSSSMSIPRSGSSLNTERSSNSQKQVSPNLSQTRISKGSVTSNQQSVPRLSKAESSKKDDSNSRIERKKNL